MRAIMAVLALLLLAGRAEAAQPVCAQKTWAGKSHCKARHDRRLPTRHDSNDVSPADRERSMEALRRNSIQSIESELRRQRLSQ
jgi:hypothetical protein